MTVPLTDLYLPVKINGDMALLLAVEKLLLQAEEQAPGTVFDHDFIKANTVGYDAFVQHLQQQNMEELVQAAGVDLPQIQALAQLLQHKKDHRLLGHGSYTT